MRKIYNIYKCYIYRFLYLQSSLSCWKVNLYLSLKSFLNFNRFSFLRLPCIWPRTHGRGTRRAKHIEFLGQFSPEAAEELGGPRAPIGPVHTTSFLGRIQLPTEFPAEFCREARPCVHFRPRKPTRSSSLFYGSSRPAELLGGFRADLAEELDVFGTSSSSAVCTGPQMFFLVFILVKICFFPFPCFRGLPIFPIQI